jgi:hypothetical protein
MVILSAEKNPEKNFNTESSGFFTSLRTTDKRNDIIGNSQLNRKKLKKTA